MRSRNPPTALLRGGETEENHYIQKIVEPEQDGLMGPPSEVVSKIFRMRCPEPSVTRGRVARHAAAVAWSPRAGQGCCVCESDGWGLRHPREAH